MFPNLALPDMPFTFPLGGMDIAFYAVAIVMLVTAVFTVAVKNILQSAVFLIFSFVTTAILYLLLHAEFIALAQVMAYVGGCHPRRFHHPPYDPPGRRCLRHQDSETFRGIRAFRRVRIRDDQVHLADSGHCRCDAQRT